MLAGIGDSTLVVDLGTFYVNSLLEEEDEETIGRKFKLGLSDVMTYLVNESFSWSILDSIPDEAELASDGSSASKPRALPILDRMGCDADVTFHNNPECVLLPADYLS